jgi:hypothetical protein
MSIASFTSNTKEQVLKRLKTYLENCEFQLNYEKGIRPPDGIRVSIYQTIVNGIRQIVELMQSPELTGLDGLLDNLIAIYSTVSKTRREIFDRETFQITTIVVGESQKYSFILNEYNSYLSSMKAWLIETKSSHDEGAGTPERDPWEGIDGVSEAVSKLNTKVDNLIAHMNERITVMEERLGI